MVTADRVEAVPALAGLPRQARAALAEAFDEVDVPAGERIASQGDFAYELFVIVSGIARVEQDGTTVATVGPGDIVGEIGLLLTGRRTAAIVSETPMVLLAMFDQRYRRLAREHPDVEQLVYSQSRGRLTTTAG